MCPAEIPFGALYDAGRGQYLAERFTIVHGPSARAAVERSKRRHDFHGSTLLAISATEFDRTQGDMLAGVDREIAEITGRSLCVRVLSGKHATPNAIQRRFRQSAAPAGWFSKGARNARAASFDSARRLRRKWSGLAETGETPRLSPSLLIGGTAYAYLNVRNVKVS